MVKWFKAEMVGKRALPLYRVKGGLGKSSLFSGQKLG
jgi:hypothetical protein